MEINMINKKNIDFIGHIILPPEFSLNLIQDTNISNINNIILKADSQENQWIENVTKKIGDWRGIFTSTYMRWALAINGLHIASEKYKSKEFTEKKKFIISSARVKNGSASVETIAEWTGKYTSEACLKTLPSMCTYGLIEFYGVLEECIFDFYRTFLNSNPEVLMEGSEYRYLKTLRNEYIKNPTDNHEWNNAWKERLLKWQKKKIYSGLDKVFLGFCDHAKLKTPSSFTQTTINTWSETIKSIAILRNCLVHNVTIVDDEFDEIADKHHTQAYCFKKGEEITLNLEHLQNLELFSNQLLDALNLSLLEAMSF